MWLQADNMNRDRIRSALDLSQVHLCMGFICHKMDKSETFVIVPRVSTVSRESELQDSTLNYRHENKKSRERGAREAWSTT